MHELHEAARAVAALLHFTAVGVEDAVAEIGFAVVRRLDDQDLVAAHAAMAIGEMFQLGWTQGESFTGAIQDHEIVTRSLHLGERQLHAALRTQAAIRSIDASSSSGWMGRDRTVLETFSETGRETPLAMLAYAGCWCSGIG